MAINNRRSSGGLEPKHARQFLSLPGGMVFFIAAPISGDIPCIANRQKMEVRRAAQLIANLERSGFLSFNPDGVDAVDDFDLAGFTEFAHNAKRVIEISFDRNG